MQTPARFAHLPPYAFPRLRALLDAHAPGGPAIALSIGEPTHPTLPGLAAIIEGAAAGFGKYPPNEGAPDLLAAISDWIGRRFGTPVGTERLMVLNGSREGLFAVTQALCPETKAGRPPLVAMPNPFYQVYAVAALAAGAEALFLPATPDTGHLPDLDAIAPQTLDRIAVFYLCTPANPQGAVASEAYLARLLDLAQRHDFVIVSDECYSEVWRDAPPPGLLAVAAAQGADPERVVVINSLSKRSNVPGLRSGFVAAGPASIGLIRQLRAYAGAPVPLPLQVASAALWRDEAHVEASRAMYLKKYALAQQILGDIPGVTVPQAGFFLWLPVRDHDPDRGPDSVPDGEAAALRLWREAGVRVLPGAYLARAVDGVNPGAGFVRVALVGEDATLARGLRAIARVLYDKPCAEGASEPEAG